MNDRRPLDGNRIRLIAHPGLPKGAQMLEKKMDRKKPKEHETASGTPPSTGGGKSLALKSFLLLLVPIIAVAAAYRAGLLEPAVRLIRSNKAIGEPGSVFNALPVDNLISSRKLLSGIGKSPVDPSRVLFPSFDESGGGNASDTGRSCPPELLGVTPDQAKVNVEKVVPAGSIALPESGANSPDSSGRPAIVTRKPADGNGAGAKESSAKAASSVAKDSRNVRNNRSGKGVKQAVGAETKKSGNDTGKAPSSRVKNPRALSKADQKSGAGKQQKADRQDNQSQRSREAVAASADAAKGERFQLPGSLLVKIKNYEGSLTKWGIMVILDDSISMARKSKTWTPNRSEAAVSLIEELPKAITPGSKIAVRDFLCRKSSKRRRGVCLSHLLYDWSIAPFKDLKETLNKADSKGWNNPCAAAAYAVKRDLSGLGRLAPRVLVVTGGATKCVGSSVVKAIDRYGDDKVPVDVIGLGMRRRYQRGYARMVKKAGGLFLKVDNRQKLDRALSRYKKALHKREMEKVEVRGDNVVFTVTPGEEITLAPGSYSVILPLVGRLKASKRTIYDVKIKSGETNVLQIKIRKGRPIVRFAKK
jgi:hypothetical protein